VSATSSSGLAVVFSSNTNICTVSGTAVTLIKTGTCTLAANQPGNGNYGSAQTVTQSFTVIAGSAPQTNSISFTVQPNQNFGNPQFSLAASSSSGLTVTFTSTTTSVCTVSVNWVTINTAGVCTIIANQAGNASYSAATPVTQSLTINKANQIISFAALAPLASSTVGASPISLSASTNSGLAVTYTSLTTPVCTVAGSTVTILTVGTCTIAADQAGNISYTAAPEVVRSFAVNAATQTISMAVLSTVTLGVAPFKVNATSSSGLVTTLTSATPLICMVTGNTVTLVGVGTCTLAAAQAGSTSYQAAVPVTQSFSVAAPVLTISLLNPTVTTVLTTPASLTLTATASESGGTIAQVAFYNGTALMGTVTQAPYSIVIPGIAAGTYQLSAQVTDGYGIMATSSVVTITVMAGSTTGTTGTEQLYDISTDQLDTPRQITDQNGTVVWSWDGEAFGSTPPNANPSGTGSFTFNLRFPGQYFDGETNLNQNTYRDYDPSTGRYVESDPLGFGGGQLSTYAYVGGNPVSRIDPSGNIPIFLVTGAIGGIGGFVGNVGYQLYDNGGQLGGVKWGDAGIAGASGAVAGALLPITGTTAIGAALTGAITNIAGYVATQAVNSDAITGTGIAVSGIAGTIGGGVAGTMSNPFWFAKGLSPWLSDAALTAANSDALTLGRAVAGAAIGSVSPSSSNSSCK